MVPEPTPGPGSRALRPEVTAIAAVASNRVIGADGDIPWRIAEDWARFKRLTLGHVLVMGRRTYDSIGRPLPGRHTVVLTRDPAWWPDGVAKGSAGQGAPLDVVTDVDQALTRALEVDPAGPVFVAGGAEIYRLCWDRLSALELTEVEQSPDGSVRFPMVEPSEWQVVDRDPRDGYAFVRYTRRGDETAPVPVADR